jgi:hypothetical protein
MVNCLKFSSCSESPFLSGCANSYGASCEASDVPSVKLPLRRCRSPDVQSVQSMFSHGRRGLSGLPAVLALRA